MWIRSALAMLGAVSCVMAQGPTLTFNVVALDGKGGPVGGLQAADLRIYDDGKPMHAAFCRPVETAVRQSAPFGPREYSNRPVGGKAQSTLILFDLLNANLAERGMGWNEIGRSLQKVESSDHIYLYLLTKEATLYPIHAMPDAGSPVVADDSAWAAQVTTLLDQAMQTNSRLRTWEFQVDAAARAEKTLDVVRDLASDLAAQPGRKSLV